jgi:hypothetical protein
VNYLCWKNCFFPRELALCFRDKPEKCSKFLWSSESYDSWKNSPS